MAAEEGALSKLSPVERKTFHGLCATDIDTVIEDEEKTSKECINVSAWLAYKATDTRYLIWEILNHDHGFSDKVCEEVFNFIKEHFESARQLYLSIKPDKHIKVIAFL